MPLIADYFMQLFIIRHTRQVACYKVSCPAGGALHNSGFLDHPVHFSDSEQGKPYAKMADKLVNFRVNLVLPQSTKRFRENDFQVCPLSFLFHLSAGTALQPERILQRNNQRFHPCLDTKLRQGEKDVLMQVNGQHSMHAFEFRSRRQVLKRVFLQHDRQVVRLFPNNGDIPGIVQIVLTTTFSAVGTAGAKLFHIA